MRCERGRPAGMVSDFGSHAGLQADLSSGAAGALVVVSALTGAPRGSEAAAVRLALPGEVERREVAFTAWGWRERVAGAGFELRLAVATVATDRFRLEAELPQGGAPTVVVSPPALSLARSTPA